MLFVNFLCLLYLMLLVNGHTLSKNIDNFYSDERVDSLHDSEYTSRQKSKYDKFLHKYRRFKSGVTETTRKITDRDTTRDSKTKESTPKPHHLKVHKSTRKIGGFWRKYKFKDNKILQRDKRLKHRLENGKYTYEIPHLRSKSKVNRRFTKTTQRTHTNTFEKKKRGITRKIKKRLNKHKEQKGLKNIQVNVTPYENYGNIVKVITQFKDPSDNTDLNQLITTIGTRVAELKKLYGLDERSSTEPIRKYLYTPKRTTSSAITTTEVDFLGTAQIEDLLNDIKGKAILMITEQNPGITELITNTATEATFEADPILNHLDINLPNYLLHTFINFNSDYGKRDSNVGNYTNKQGLNNGKMTTYKFRKERSIKEDAMTAAQNIEDILQKEMKNIYKKVKNKVSGDFRKEVDKVKTTLKPKTKKPVNTGAPKNQTHTCKTPAQTSKTYLSTTPLLQNRIDRKSGKQTKVTKQEITTTPTVDDYALLTLYEQMLAKTCQNNILSMVTTQASLIRKKRNKQLISNRNFETLFDQKLKDDVKKLYEDREEIPDDLEYNFELNIPEISTAETITEKDSSKISDNDSEIKNDFNEDLNTEINPIDDNSYESLTSKISYVEFVNGYKHYLNFQKELANQNFSNLVRYQAHRHHSVDDIGKYILNKIPQIPSRDKRFLEYGDDHETSTKAEKSWFKKHFYIFIENGTPKKYYTSQTISLKSPTPDAYDTLIPRIEYLESTELDDKQKMSSEAESKVADINLEQLSQLLEARKTSTAVLSIKGIEQTDSGIKNADKCHAHILKSRTPLHIINKVFGKNRKAPHKVHVRSKTGRDLDYSGFDTTNDIENNIFLYANDVDRMKRNAKNRKVKSTTINEKLNLHTKKMEKLNDMTKTTKKLNNGKQGCVDIDLIVPPPTALVKLKGAKPKESKFKKLLHKFHFSKCNEKKVKREYNNFEYIRKQRLNPLQILKNMFKSTPKAKNFKNNYHLSDYEMITSHIDTFKPIKYQKVLSLEEMRKQIPNITDVNTLPELVASNDYSWETPTTEKGFTDFTNTVATFLPQVVEGRVRYPIFRTTEKINTLSISDLMRANIVTKLSYKPSKNSENFPQHMALEDIRNQVEDIINKISTKDPFKTSSTKGTTNYNMLLTNEETSNRHLPNIINYPSIFFSQIKPCSKAYLKARPKTESHTVLDLNRRSEMFENNSTLKAPGVDFKLDEAKQTSIAIPIHTMNLFTLGGSLQEDESVKYKHFPDYFSDLLMWHKDILYSDKVPTPWRDILKNMNQEPEYSSPYIGDLQLELIKINDALNSYNFKSKDLNMNAITDLPTPLTNFKSISRNGLHNTVLEKPPSGKNILIKDENKIVKSNPKKIKDSNLKAAGFGSGIKKVAKNLSDETSYKLIKMQDATESYIDNRGHKDQSVILVDTTLLSYDDDVNYVSTLTPRELSKYEKHHSNKDKNSALSHKAKCNKQPAQYFSTPLPMRMTDFEEFLKAHKIDVESVTSPLTGIPTMSSYGPRETPEMKTLTKDIFNMINSPQKTIKLKTTPKLVSIFKRKYSIDGEKYEAESGNQFDYLNFLERGLFEEYNSERKDRHRRYTDDLNKMFMNYNSNKNSESFNNKENKIMKKPKIIHNKPITDQIPELKISTAADDITPNDFEITIINFGDLNKLTDTDTATPTEKVVEVTESNFKDRDKAHLSIESIEKDSKDSQFLQKLHNDYFYDTKNKDNIAEKTKAANINKIKDLAPISLHEAMLNKMPIKAKGHPKRVRISSESYKYDIIYHQPEKKHHYRDTLSIPSYVKAMDMSTPENMVPSYNRDFVGEGDVARSDVSKTRFARKVKTSNKNSPESTKTSPTITFNAGLRKPVKHHRLERLFPVIQNKFKMFSKTLSTSSDFQQTPTTIILTTSDNNSSPGSVTTIDNKKTSILLLSNGTGIGKVTKKFAKNTTNATFEKKLNMVKSESENATDSVLVNNHKLDELSGYVKLQEYPEIESNDSPTTKGTRNSNLTKLKSIKEYINKREIQGLETHTAKDVAALEVIVDMMKNPLNYDDTNPPFGSFYENRNNKFRTSDKAYPFANSIQVHIAVPFEVENGKKRSLEPIKVRKVFSAKLCTPVDIEYQVHSFEARPTTEKAVDSVEGLTPGVYLLVDNAYFPQGVALKPVPPNLPLMNVRQVKSTTEKITSTISTKNLAKVTLSKDFISAINKQLIQLYNLTTINNEQQDEIKKERKFKRSLNWEAVKKLFGHDRVCHCKCKVNKTLCRACAASDAVMSELIFEFENLSKYMKDHCTEIQTYFWMNPSGGKKLKDSVHKIDQSLRDYYKRVKGKCQGRTCKTFATYIDKRALHKYNKRKEYAGDNFINDLEALMKDVGKVSKTVTCFRDNLTEEFNQLKYVINECVYQKPYDKRSKSMYRPGKDIKNVYSLDNVNVNIICKSESTVSFPSATSSNEEKTVWMDSEYKEKNSKGFKRLFSCFRKKKKDKSLSEYWKQTTKQFAKRAVKENQIESPLISDTGGSFWHDYIKKSSSIPTFPRGIKPKIKISLFQTKRDSVTSGLKHEDRNNVAFTTFLAEKHTKQVITDDATNTEPTNNYNEFLKLFNITDVSEISKTPNKETTELQKIITHESKEKKTKIKKPKTKIHQTVKTKMHKKIKQIDVPSPLNNTKTRNYTTKLCTTTPYMKFITSTTILKMKSNREIKTKTIMRTKTSSKNQLLNKIKMITTGFFHIKNKTKNAASTERGHYSVNTSPQCKLNTGQLKKPKNDTHVTSEPTTEINSDIVIIDDVEGTRLNKYKDLLLSIIDYESNKLNREWMKIANININKLETNDQKTTKTLKNASKYKEMTINYDVLRDLQGMLPSRINNIGNTRPISYLLDKISNKFKTKLDNQESKKAGAEQKTQSGGQPSTMKTTSQTAPVGKEADDTAAAPRLCNMEVTRQHILRIQRDMPLKDFENYIANVTCQKYEKVPRTIFLGTTKARDKDKNLRKWSWIRDRRSLLQSKINRVEKINSRVLQDRSLEFEVFFKGDHGIYQQASRRKRSVDSKDLLIGLRDLPRLRRSENEIHAIAGDTVKFSCLNSLKHFHKNVTQVQCSWETERRGMLNYSNVAVHDDLITITEVQPKNDGCYSCKKGSTKREIKLAVLTLPNFIWTSTLLFTKETECTHHDLKKMRLLGPEIFKKVFQRQSCVTISDPVCLEDRVNAKNKLGAVVKVNCRPPPVNCSVQCRRNLQAAFATMCADNVQAMASIAVMAPENGVNSTWKPSKRHVRLIVTRTPKGLINPYAYKMLKEFTPEKHHLVVSCRGGYRLVSDLKICAPCPTNMYAREGDNACSVCPRGLSSSPGADKCRRTTSRSRRYDWWIYPPCGYGLAAVVAVCCCGVCVALALLVHVTTRSCGATDTQKLKQNKHPRKTECHMNPNPTRSSRVILARFFKPSLTSSMATDSQETKFDMWRARNLPPPLPPVDFDS